VGSRGRGKGQSVKRRVARGSLQARGGPLMSGDTLRTIGGVGGVGQGHCERGIRWSLMRAQGCDVVERRLCSAWPAMYGPRQSSERTPSQFFWVNGRCRSEIRGHVAGSVECGIGGHVDCEASVLDSPF
jgi:hypothetical protein